MQVGDRVLVIPSMGVNYAVTLGGVNVKDTVMLYPLKDSTRIAVPTLSFSIGDFVFTSPSFQFAGFDWKVDFNFNLIPLVLGLQKITRWYYVGPEYFEGPGIEQYKEVKIGTIVLDWDGLTRVWISNYKDKIYATADDGYRIYNRTNSQMKDLRNPYFGVYQNYPPPEITSILSEGENELDIYVKDWYASYIACPTVYLLVTLG